MHRIPFAIAAFLLAAAGPAPVIAADPPPAYSGTAKPLLTAYCVRCHNAKKPEGGVDLTSIADDAAALAKRKLWKHAWARVVAGDMPPEGAKPLTPDDKKKLTAWLAAAADYLDCDPARRDPGPSTLRRLTRTEYQNTIRDLFYGQFRMNARIDAGMPDEDFGEGQFDNLAVGLQISPTMMEKYFTGADKVAEAFAANGELRKRFINLKPGSKLSEPEAARQVLTNFARRAYRRAPEPADVERLLGFYERARAKGGSFEDGIGATVKPVLVSPKFLYRIEADRPATGPTPGVLVDDYELASRLSYFLWSTMPDDELFRLAELKKLSEPAELEKQVRRMLKDRRARALMDALADHWLLLKTLSNARPTTEFFPTFRAGVKQAMGDEVRLFVDNLRIEDRPVLDLLDADYTFANADLAKFYGLPDVTGRQMRKVPLPPNAHRGGVLGMGAVLTMTSHTFRTSPTQRGKYVLAVILGAPPPPPPPDVGQLKDEDPKGKKKAPETFREQLARHATQAGCSGCHKKIDPLGFALDNYNAVGLWRDSTPAVPLDVGGVLPTGEKVNGAADLKKLLLARKDEFARNLAAKVLEYALGRDLDGQDECTVREVLAALRKDDYRFSTLILGTVQSVPFRQRRVIGASGQRDPAVPANR